MTGLEILAGNLAKQGLSMVGNAVLKRGKKEVEQRLGVTLDEQPTPEQVHAIKAAAIHHYEFLVAAANEDRADARSSMNKSKVNQLFAHGLAGFWSIASIVFVFGVVFTEIPQENVRFADTIIGFVLGTIIATIINFYYGSSNPPDAPEQEPKP